MSGYTEALTDPSYSGQILTLTYPLVGNYGIPDVLEKDEDGIQKYTESDRIQIRALVVHELSLTASHWNLDMTLDEWLYNEKIPGIAGIDTRALTTKLRTEGVMMGILAVSEKEIDEKHSRHSLQSAKKYNDDEFMSDSVHKRAQDIWYWTRINCSRRHWCQKCDTAQCAKT
ncbi:Carbamoyl-phosphate synthase small chain [Candidatus Nitrosotalea sp. TS]|nr:Carbamoyl-phosphate synthase small chain [Candidatus Nitrosotalea sp. TS]